MSEEGCWPSQPPCSPPSTAPDASIAGPANGGSTTVRFPRGSSGRVYFSLGEKLKFFLTPTGLVQPAPWAGGDPNRDILFDWSEFTYNDAGLWLNSSQVDMFAVPHAVTVTGAGGVTKRTGDVVAGGRNAIINGIRAQSGWASAVRRAQPGHPRHHPHPAQHQRRRVLPQQPDQPVRPDHPRQHARREGVRLRLRRRRRVRVARPRRRPPLRRSGPQPVLTVPVAADLPRATGAY